VPASENFADASWEKDSTVVGASVAGPFSGSVGTHDRGNKPTACSASTVLPSGGAIALLLCGSVYVLSPSAGALVLGFIDSGFTLLASQSCSLPANQWTRISFAATLTSLLPVRLLIGGLNSWNGPLSLFGAQVAPLGAAGVRLRQRRGFHHVRHSREGVEARADRACAESGDRQVPDGRGGAATADGQLLAQSGIISIFDWDGNLVEQEEPIHTGSPLLPVNWKGDGQEYVLLSGNVREGGMVDGHLRRV